MTYFYKIAGLAVLALLVQFQAVAQPQPKVGDAIGDWIFTCQALSASQTACALTQTIVEKETKQPVLHLTLRKLGQDQQLALIANVPLGVYLASGIAGKVDEGEQFNLIWQICTKEICQAALALDDAKRAAFQAGSKLLIGFKPRPDAQPYTVAASLKGVTAGLAALDAQ